MEFDDLLIRKQVHDLINKYVRFPNDIIKLIMSYYWTITPISMGNILFQFPDGSIKGWDNYGDNMSSDIIKYLQKCSNIYPLYSKNQSNVDSFYGVSDDGIVVSWGRHGKSTNKVFSGTERIYHVLSDNSIDQITKYSIINHNFHEKIKHIYSENNGYGSVALTEKNNAYAWHYHISDAKLISMNVAKIINVDEIFIIVKKDGSTVLWVNDTYNDSFEIFCNNLKNISDMKKVGKTYLFLCDRTINIYDYRNNYFNLYLIELLQNKVVSIHSTEDSFAVLTNENNIITWGDRDLEMYDNVNKLLFDITKIITNNKSFLAIRKDGTIIIWGSFGIDTFKTEDSILSVHNTNSGFSVLYDSGSVIVKDRGKKTYLIDNIETINTCSDLFLGIKKNGETCFWGYKSYPKISKN